MTDIFIEVEEAECCHKCELKDCQLDEMHTTLSTVKHENDTLRQKLFLYENNITLASSLYNSAPQSAQILIDPHTNTPVLGVLESLPIRTSPEMFIPTVYINQTNSMSADDTWATEAEAPNSTATSVAFDSDNSGDMDNATSGEEMKTYPSTYTDTIYDFSNDICSYISANITRGVSSSTIQKCLATAHNEAHFAARLAQKMFTKEELSTSNITGRTSIPGRVIHKLDSARLELIKQAVCHAYKMDSNTEEMKSIWKKCKMSINEVCRRPRRSRVQLSSSPHKYVTTKGLTKSPKIEPMATQLMTYLAPSSNLAQLISYQTDAHIVPNGGSDLILFQNNIDMSHLSPHNMIALKEEPSEQDSETSN